MRERTVKKETRSAQQPSRWKRLLPTLKSLDGSLELVTVLQQLLKLLQQAAPEHSAGIFLRDEETRMIQGQATELFDPDLNGGQGAFPEALCLQAPFLISDLFGRARKAQPSDKNARTQIVVPLQLSAQARGALVLRSRERKAYTKQDGEALAQFAQGASARIENALLRQQLLRAGEAETERDLVMAQEIMARLIPRQPPQIPGFEVASVYVPAKVVGGDLLNFIVLPDDHYGFLVADAAGNGIPSALLMTGFRAMFRGLIKNDFNIRAVFHKANNQLVESTALPHQFVSAFYGALDVSTSRLIYINGGHVPPLLYRHGNPVQRLDMGGPVLGILPGASYHEDSVMLRHEDILVCFSDGLSEAENAAGEAFDDSRILQVVERNRRRPAETICAALQEEASRFVGHPLHDDLTICVLKFP